MKRALFFVLAAACAARPAPVVPHAPARMAVATASASTPPPPPPKAPTTAERIAAFAAARGGLHGAPVAMPYRRFDLKDAPCWLFFVGGDAAHAAWLATPWDPAWGKARAGLPHVSAETQATVLQDGVVFERVVGWPRAVRVVSTNAAPDGLFVDVETVAALDQPAGEKGVFLVHDDIGAGSLPVAVPDWQRVVGAAGSVPDAQARSALRSPPLANVAFYESPQLGIVKRAPANAAAMTRAIRAARDRACRYDGTCLDEAGRGVVLVPSGANVRVGAIIVGPSVSSPKEPAPIAAPPDDALVAFRMNETASGTLRVVASVAIGSSRVLVAEDDREAYLVERDGAFSRVTDVWTRRNEKAKLEARLDDVDGDGIADVVLFARWPAQDDKDPFEAHTEAMLVRRFGRVGTDPVRDGLGVEIDLLGARDLDDAARRARSPVVPVTPTAAQACALLAASATRAGLLAHATAGARIASFAEPMQPAAAGRVVPVARASDDDAAQLKAACSDPSEGGFTCRDGLCGNLDYALGSLYRFVRERGALKLEAALLYTGS